MEKGGLVPEAVLRLQESLRGVRFGTVTLRVTVRHGQCVHAEVERTDSLRVRDYGGDWGDPQRDGGR